MPFFIPQLPLDSTFSTQWMKKTNSKNEIFIKKFFQLSTLRELFRVHFPRSESLTCGSKKKKPGVKSFCFPSVRPRCSKRIYNV